MTHFQAMYPHTPMGALDPRGPVKMNQDGLALDLSRAALLNGIHIPRRSERCSSAASRKR